MFTMELNGSFAAGSEDNDVQLAPGEVSSLLSRVRNVLQSFTEVFTSIWIRLWNCNKQKDVGQNLTNRTRNVHFLQLFPASILLASLSLWSCVWVLNLRQQPPFQPSLLPSERGGIRDLTPQESSYMGLGGRGGGFTCNVSGWPEMRSRGFMERTISVAGWDFKEHRRGNFWRANRTGKQEKVSEKILWKI